MIGQKGIQTGDFGTARIGGRVLVVVCAYHGGANGGRAWRCPIIPALPKVATLGNILTLYPLRAHVAQMRDHFANPRDLPLQLEIARDALAQGDPKSVQVLLDTRHAATAPAPFPFGSNPPALVDLREPIAAQNVDTVLIVYPDALGLGFGSLESPLRRQCGNIVVVNGRRRMFPLTAQSRRALLWRRALAATRLPELLAAALILPLAAALALYDRLKPDTRSS